MTPLPSSIDTILTTRLRNIISGHRSRAKKYGRKLDYSLDDLRGLLGNVLTLPRCPFCKNRVTVATFTFDHSYPVSRGGSFELSNLVVCCDPCNRAKCNLSRDEFIELLEVLDGFDPPIKVSIMSRLKAGACVFAKPRLRRAKRHR